MNCDFVIKNPRWALAIAWTFAALGLTAVIAATALHFSTALNDTAFIAWEAAGSAFAFIGLLCVYVGMMEKFELKDGVFSYRKPFKKTQSAAVEDVARVAVYGTVSLKSWISDVVFYDKDGNKLINFYDDGTAFRDGKFERALIALKIPFARYTSPRGLEGDI